MRNNTLRAFSILEISVILAILGLLVGGVLTGRELIRAAEIRSITNDVARFTAAIDTFKSKYRELPGDMKHAVKYWGAADGGDGVGVDCRDAVSTNGTTCNGNGNGELRRDDATGDYGQEWFHGWVQLANAGLVEGAFTGRRGPNDGRHAVPGVNIPANNDMGGGYTLMSITWPNGFASSWYDGHYELMLMFGAESDYWETDQPILTAVEAHKIDHKNDDGKPGLGKIRTHQNNADCVTQLGRANQLTAEYNTTVDVIACSLVFSLNNPET